MVLDGRGCFRLIKARRSLARLPLQVKSNHAYLCRAVLVFRISKKKNDLNSMTFSKKNSFHCVVKKRLE